MIRRLGLLALLAIAAMGAGAAWLDHQLNRHYKGYSEGQVFVDIPRGSSRWQTASLLAKSGAVPSRLAFEALSEWRRRTPLLAGEYQFDHPMTARQVFEKIAAGKIFFHLVKVPEGWTTFEIAAELERQGLCSKDGFLAATHDTSLIADLAPRAKTLEGFLFPDTYEISRHMTCGDIAAAMVHRFRAVWQTLEPSGSAKFPSGLTLEQIVTIASLVERETANPGERRLVAGVFYNRLRREFPLQCDPTVQYALELAGRFEKNVGPADLRFNSPYNTYEHRGLPPGPIANPGEASLHAALAPEPTDFMYFVANDQGGHFFSRTLAEHNRNVARYRRLVDGESASPDPPPKKKMKHPRDS